MTRWTVFFDRSRAPGDVPAPPTPDEVAAGFPVPLFTFVSQPHLEEASVSLMDETSNGVRVMAAATLSYTVWRNPADHADPVNLAELPPGLRDQLAMQPPWPLPDWMLQCRERMRHPLLWDAVRTTWVSDVGPSGAGTRRSVAALLAEHANYILMNQFRDERLPAGFPGDLLGRHAPSSVETGVPVVVDGVPVPGAAVASDPHVLGLGADLGERVLTAVVPREWLPLLILEFATRSTSR